MTNKHPSAEVFQVLPGSLAEEVGLAPGDRIMRINGRTLRDLIDYHLAEASNRLILEVAKADGEFREIDLENEEGWGLGVVFNSAVFDGIRVCRNKCLFCFVDQMPPGMRPSLYLKDDDYRLSFLQGSYITLSNLSAEDWQRIKRERLSPLYISVHATQPEVRERLFGAEKAREIMSHLEQLASWGIKMHTQAVIVPGINDGAVLEKTISDLGGLWPSVLSLAVVPVGLTRHRAGLPELKRFSPTEARAVLELVHRKQREFLSEFGTRLVFPADEFLIQAGAEFPPLAEYEDLWQLENGVGLWALFKEEFTEELERTVPPSGRRRPGEYLVVTGIDAAALWKELKEKLVVKYPEIKLAIKPVPNFFFGREVTVTGLLTGRDIVSALRNNDLRPEQIVLLPRVMLRRGEDVFLDGMTVGELEEILGVPVKVVEVSGKAAARTILGLEEKNDGDTGGGNCGSTECR